jgi:hypothetical protein
VPLKHKLIGFLTEMKSVYSAVRTGSLTLSLLTSYIYIYIYLFIYSFIYGTTSKARNLMYLYGRDFLLEILLLEPCISLIYA